MKNIWCPVNVVPDLSKAIVYITADKKMGVISPIPDKEDWLKVWESYHFEHYISYWAYQDRLMDFFSDEMWEKEYPAYLNGFDTNDEEEKVDTLVIQACIPVGVESFLIQNKPERGIIQIDLTYYCDGEKKMVMELRANNKSLEIVEGDFGLDDWDLIDMTSCLQRQLSDGEYDFVLDKEYK